MSSQDNSLKSTIAVSLTNYLDAGAILVVEWSENIENALPADAIRLRLQRVDDCTRLIERE